MGMLNGFTGKVKPLPIVGQYGFKFGLLKNGGSGEKLPPDSE